MQSFVTSGFTLEKRAPGQPEEPDLRACIFETNLLTNLPIRL
mgnify:CR=1 FL=1